MSTQIEMLETEAVEREPLRADDLGPILRDIAFVLHLTRRMKQEMTGKPDVITQTCESA